MKLVIVTGAPCSGKTTYAIQHAGRGDVVVDYDRLVNALTINGMHDNNPALVPYVNAARRLLVDQLADEPMVGAVYLTALHEPEWTSGLTYYDIERVQMDADAATCMERLHTDADGRDMEATEALILEYFNEN